MKHLINYLLLLLLGVNLLNAQAPQFKNFSLYDHDFSDHARALAIDKNKNSYIASYSGGSNTASSGFSVTKIDSNYNVIWEYDGSVYSVSPPDEVGAFDIDLDDWQNVYVALHVDGGTTFGTDTLLAPDGDFVVKLDSAGNPVWGTKITHQSNFFNARQDLFLVCSPIGETYVSGYFYNQVIIGNDTLNSLGSADVYLAKLDSSGNVQWAISQGSASSNDDYMHGLSIDSLGNVSIYIQRDLGVNRDIFKYSPSGSLISQISLPSYGSLQINFLKYHMDFKGNHYLVGQQPNSIQFAYGDTFNNVNGEASVILKLDSSGNYLNHIVVVDVADISGFEPWRIFADAEENTYLIGGTYYTYQFSGHDSIWSNSFYMIKHSSTGNLKWVKSFANHFGNGTYTNFRDIAFSDNDIYVTGNLTTMGDSVDGFYVNSFWLDNFLGNLCKYSPSVPSFDYVSNGNQITFYDSTLNHNSNWYWDFGNGDTSVSQNPVYNYSSQGTYFVCLTTKNECGEVTFCDSISTGITTDIFNINSLDLITITPNPAKDYIILTYKSNDTKHISLHNIIGEHLESITVKENERVNISNYPAGTYFLKSLSGEVAKFIIID